MRHINLERIKEILGTEKVKAWEDKEQEYLTKLKGMTKEERSDFFTKHNDWTELYAVMANLSFNKCWYSEAPSGSNEWEMDHFRPKNRSRNHDGKVILKEGYWWLAYNWRNFRLTGSLVNKRRRDKFNPTEDVYGKGDYFPLDLNNGIACTQDGDLEEEVILLLDPTVFYDTTLLTFDSTGEPIPTARDNTLEFERVIISIELLGLKHMSSQRKKIWDSCELEILEAQTKFKRTTNAILRQSKLRSSFDKIRQLAMPENPYSSVAKSCIKVYSKKSDYEWLSDVLESL
jgi:hypothetical protein